MSRHHNLDISPDPKSVLYINETGIADPSTYDLLPGRSDKNEKDNLRIYIPLDLNQSSILRRLRQIGYMLGDPTESNESDYSIEVQNIITELEIYDQVWFVREGDFPPSEPGTEQHSKHGRDLVEKILEQLEEWEECGCAECFPYNEIDSLEDDYGIVREHGWK